ncbi:MAG: CDP-glycerol glycerophosphotransferase family protein [Akkermansia sp.]|nr:CDP-glycerol glycerophosphotransferase family protein [Akkermansia sp.]
MLKFLHRFANRVIRKFIFSYTPYCSTSSLRRYIAKKTALWKHLSALEDKVRQKQRITVAFTVYDLPCWRCDSVMQRMLRDSRFRPFIWILPQFKDSDEQRRNLEIMLAYFSVRRYPVAVYGTLEEIRKKYAPDVCILSKLPSAPVRAMDMDQELTCYLPYCYQNTQKLDFINIQSCYVWRNFYATPGIKRVASSVMANGGCNVVVVGSPVADNYFADEEDDASLVWRSCGEGMKRIIWAPHWSVNSESWFNVATFLDVAEGMIQLAEKYADKVQWAFKPHPLLRSTLYKLPDWGKERTDAYYARWANMPNCQLETGAYVELFKQSDAMVHDSGSFIMEYLLVNKPCMYLRKQGGFNDFNDDTLKALDCYRKGSTVRDVEKFIQDLLNEVDDSFKEKRSRFRDEYLIPPGGSCAQLIIDEILKGK